MDQEASNYLWDLINQDENDQFLDYIPEVMPAPVTAHSSLPAITDWPGDFAFNVTFNVQDVRNQNAKNINWIFSETERKLYVKKDFPCAINFSTSAYLSPGAVVRAMAVYTSPEHASKAVHRCPTHIRDEIDLGKPEVFHLIHSECVGADYIQHMGSNRHSVVVPFEKPPAGQCFSTYIYKFVCWNSCPGGPNRRPLTLVFTLEENNTVLGRRTMDLKICACPGRDSGAVPKIPKPNSSKKMKVEPEEPQVTVPKRKLEEKNKFTIETTDIECFDFLKKMKRMYMANKKLSGLPQHWRGVISWMISSSGSSEEDEQNGSTHEQ